MRTTIFFPKAMRRILRRHGLLAGAMMLTASAQAVTLSGRLTDESVGLSGITINYNWTGPFGGTGSGSVVSGANGNWSSPGWGPSTAVTFTPSQGGYSWSPGSRSINTGLSGDQEIGRASCRARE